MIELVQALESEFKVNRALLVSILQAKLHRPKVC